LARLALDFPVDDGGVDEARHNGRSAGPAGYSVHAIECCSPEQHTTATHNNGSHDPEAPER